MKSNIFLFVLLFSKLVISSDVQFRFIPNFELKEKYYRNCMIVGEDTESLKPHSVCYPERQRTPKKNEELLNQIIKKNEEGYSSIGDFISVTAKSYAISCELEYLNFLEKELLRSFNGLDVVFSSEVNSPQLVTNFEPGASYIGYNKELLILPDHSYTDWCENKQKLLREISSSKLMISEFEDANLEIGADLRTVEQSLKPAVEFLQNSDHLDILKIDYCGDGKIAISSAGKHQEIVVRKKPKKVVSRCVVDDRLWDLIDWANEETARIAEENKRRFGSESPYGMEGGLISNYAFESEIDKLCAQGFRFGYLYAEVKIITDSGNESYKKISMYGVMGQGFEKERKLAKQAGIDGTYILEATSLISNLNGFKRNKFISENPAPDGFYWFQDWRTGEFILEEIQVFEGEGMMYPGMGMPGF